MLCALGTSCTQIDVKPFLDRTDGGLQPVTTPFLLLGDTQEHEITGLPAAVVGGTLDRSLAKVTIRPPQQALFGRFLFADALHAEPTIPLLHLGDVIDVSCKSELRRYWRILELAGRTLQADWIIAPGNHDGTAHGIFNISNDDATSSGFDGHAWDLECREPSPAIPLHFLKDIQGTALSRDMILTWYARIKQAIDASAILKVGTPDIPAGKISWSSSVSTAILQRMVGNVVPRYPLGHGNFSNSYLIQKLSMPAVTDGSTHLKVSIILLDTTQFPGRLDRIGHLALSVGRANPGSSGYLQADQIAEIARLVREQAKDEIIIFAGHHDWDSMDYQVKWALGPILAEADNPLVYLSAHTHEGFWRRWTVGGRPMLEFNVNSMADWPIAFRRLSIASSDKRDLLRVTAGIEIADQQHTAPLSADQTDAGVKTPDSTSMLALWRSHCNFDDVNFDTLLRDHERIVTAHRAGRQKVRNFLAIFLPHGAARDRAIYFDKINDLVMAGRSLLQAAKDFPLLEDLLNANDAYGENTSSIGSPACVGKSILPCLKILPDVRAPSSTEPSSEKLDTEDLKPDPTYDSVQQRYHDLARVITASQAVLDKVTSPDLQHQLACTAVAAAVLDKSEEDGTGNPLDRIPLTSTFYATHGDATDNPAPN